VRTSVTEWAHGRILANNPHRQIQAWLYIAVVFATLTIVKWVSIQTGPSADEAIVAIRLAQRELAEAQWVHRDSEPLNLKNAEDALNVAWSMFDEDHYEGAIVEAQKVIAVSRKLND
jgi:hypothetical protein